MWCAVDAIVDERKKERKKEEGKSGEIFIFVVLEIGPELPDHCTNHWC